MVDISKRIKRKRHLCGRFRPSGLKYRGVTCGDPDKTVRMWSKRVCLVQSWESRLGMFLFCMNFGTLLIGTDSVSLSPQDLPISCWSGRCSGDRHHKAVRSDISLARAALAWVRVLCSPCRTSAACSDPGTCLCPRSLGLRFITPNRTHVQQEIIDLNLPLALAKRYS